MNERDYMDQVGAIAKQRVKDLGLKGKAAIRDSEAVLQGAITVATALGVMTHDRAGIIAFMVSVGRIDSILNEGEPA